jgi:hypothetical protein
MSNVHPYVPKRNNRYFDLKHLKSVHTLISPIFFYKLYSVATPGHPNHIVAITPDLQRVSFYTVIDNLYYSSTTEVILSLILVKESYPSSTWRVACIRTAWILNAYTPK